MEHSMKAEEWFEKAKEWFYEGVQHYQTGNPKEALAAWEQAAELYRDLIADNQPQYRPNLALIRMAEGETLLTLNCPEEALGCFSKAAGIYQSLIADNQPQYRLNLAHARMNEGVTLVDLNRPNEGLACCEDAARIYQALIDDNQPQYCPNLAHARMNQGNALSTLKRPKDALARYEEAAGIYQELIKNEELINKGQSQYRQNLALTRMNEGIALYDLNRPADARARYEEAAAIYQDLIDKGQPHHRLNLAHTRMREGNALVALNHAKESLARFEEAAGIYQDLIAKGEPHHRLNLAHTWMGQGNALSTLKRPADALARYREAAGIYQELIDKGQTHHRPILAHARMNEGVALSDLNRHEEARACHEEAAAIYQDLIDKGQPHHRPNLAPARMNEGNALSGLNRPDEARARHEEAAAIYQDLIDKGQPQYRPNLALTLANAAMVCADTAELETAAVYLDHALGVWEVDEAIPAVALDNTRRLADLIHRTQSATGFAARVERLAQQVARTLGGVAPEHLGQFYPLAEQAFAHLFDAALDQEAWDLALTVIGTARAQRLAKLAQADLLRRAAREDDPAELREYREAIRRFAELEILLNVGAGPDAGGDANRRGGGGDASQQYKALYDEYTAQRYRLDALEQTLRERGLLPDLGAGLFDGAGLRNRLPRQAALLLLIEVGKPPANLVVVLLTHDSGHRVPLEGWSDWTRRLDDITNTLKGRGRTLRDGPGWDTRTASAVANASNTPQESADIQAEALTKALAEQFWKPVQRVVGDAVNTVWLLPTGELHGLPWQASAPPEWRCRLAPAPWFVRQALDRTDDAPVLLHPTAAAPLGALTYAASHSDKELLHMALEESGTRAIWGEAARALAGLDQKSEPRPAFIALAGHGDSDTAIPGAARILVGREGAEPRHVGFGELWNAPLPGLQSLYLSSCVVGRTREINGEPLGLISAGLLRGARYLVGWSVPVDDLGTALFSLLYHSIWRECADPEKALTLARNAFLTGAWPTAAVERARPLLETHLRDLLVEWINVPSRQNVRKERLWKVLCDLHEDSGEAPDALESWKDQLNAWRLQQDVLGAAQSAESLATWILDRRAAFPFRYVGHFALGFGSTGHPPADV